MFDVFEYFIRYIKVCGGMIRWVFWRIKVLEKKKIKIMKNEKLKLVVIVINLKIRVYKDL